jgi:hypothetical protein
MYDPSIFFDKHSSIYVRERLTETELEMIEFIQNSRKGKISILDIGGGSGKFAKEVKNRLPDAEVWILDASQEMLNKINDDRIHQIHGELPHKVPINLKFNFIISTFFLHHLVGETIDESKNKLMDTLRFVNNLLEDGGYFLIDENYFESHFFPTLSRFIIFQLLKIQNRFRIKIPNKAFLEGLIICFYTRTEILKYTGEANFQILNYKNVEYPDDYEKKLLFLKNWGKLFVIAQRKT